MKKKLLTRLTAVTSVCVLAMCCTAVEVSAEDTVEVSDITISFDCSDEGVVVKDEDKEFLEPITVSPTSSITIPEAFPKREGYAFSCWTYDGIHAYIYGDTFRSPDGNDVTLKPVWVMDDSEVKYNLKYEVEQNGEIIDTSKELPDRKLYAGQIVTIPLNSYAYGDFAHFSWNCDGTELRGDEKFIMPAHDVTITPAWKRRYKVIYTVGDVDRVVGTTRQEYIQPETLPTGLQADNRFSRNGFKLVGWLCDDDNKVYPTSYPTYIMPSHDVTFTAVWEAKEYTVVFKQDKNSKNNIKVKGLTDTEITTPTATITQEGKYLAGWKDTEDGTVYPAGSQYMIKGAIAGKGIVLEAVWADGEPPATTTAQSAETTTSATTTTTVTTAQSSGVPPIMWGDANDNGKVNISDDELIMKSISNPSEYKLSETGKANSDVVGNDGITNSDALAIQMIDAKLISQADFPLEALPDIK